MKPIIIAIVSTFVAACAPRHIVSTDPEPPRFEVHQGPPCRMLVFADGEVQADVRHVTLPCKVTIDGQPLEPK